MIPQSQPLPDGLVILFEGIDGVGKTTQVNLARQALEAAGWPVLSTRNLGGTPIGEALRRVMLSPLPRPALTDLHISVAIQEALVDEIETARQDGRIILMDRGPLSLGAYQVYGTGIDQAVGWQYVQNGMSRLRPELSIVYTAEVERAVKRARRHSRQPDYFESQPFSYFERVASGYQAAAKRYPVEIIAADGEISDIQQQTIRLISEAVQAKLKQNQI